MDQSRRHFVSFRSFHSWLESFKRVFSVYEAAAAGTRTLPNYLTSLYLDLHLPPPILFLKKIFLRSFEKLLSSIIACSKIRLKFCHYFLQKKLKNLILKYFNCYVSWWRRPSVNVSNWSGQILAMLALNISPTFLSVHHDCAGTNIVKLILCCKVIMRQKGRNLNLNLKENVLIATI